MYLALYTAWRIDHRKLEVSPICVRLNIQRINHSCLHGSDWYILVCTEETSIDRIDSFVRERHDHLVYTRATSIDSFVRERLASVCRVRRYPWEMINKNRIYCIKWSMHTDSHKKPHVKTFYLRFIKMIEQCGLYSGMWALHALLTMQYWFFCYHFGCDTFVRERLVSVWCMWSQEFHGKPHVITLYFRFMNMIEQYWLYSGMWALHDLLTIQYRFVIIFGAKMRCRFGRETENNWYWIEMFA